MNTHPIGKAFIAAFAPHTGTARLEGLVDSHSSAAFCQQVEILLKDYRYDEIRLEVESPGGEFSAMRQMQRAIQQAKAAGVVVHTHTHTRAASAAAVLLSAGTMGHRSINPEAQLLYHHSRLMAPQAMPLTAEMAGNAQEQMDRCDRWMLESLLKDLSLGAGGQEALVNLVVERSQRMLARYDELVDELYVVAPSAAQQRSEKQTLKQLAELQGKPVEAAIKAYGAVLRKMFDRDRSINLVLAYALCLIDRVEHYDLDRDALSDGARRDVHSSETEGSESGPRMDQPRCG